MAKAKIYQFPDKRALRKMRKVPVSLLRRLQRICLLGLVVSTTFLLYENPDLLNPQLVGRLLSYMLQDAEGEDSSITINYSENMKSFPFESGIAILNNDFLSIRRGAGYTELEQQLAYADPVVDCGDKKILAYDKGGTGYMVLSRLAMLSEGATEAPIISGKMYDNGYYSLVTDEKGYKGAVTLYNDRYEPVFKWSTSEYYVMSAALSPNGKELVAACFYQEGQEAAGKILYFDLNREGIAGEVVLTGQIPLDVGYFNDGTVGVLSDGSATLIDKKQKIKTQESLRLGGLKDYLFLPSGLLYAEDSGGVGGLQLKILGDTVETYSLTGKYKAMSASKYFVSILTDDTVSVYDAYSGKLINSQAEFSAKDVVITKEGIVYLIYSDHIALLSHKGATK